MNEELMSRLYDESKVYRDTEWGEKIRFFDHRKFAELIIQECIEIVLSSDPSPKMTVREPYGTIMENIKEHFGWHDE